MCTLIFSQLSEAFRKVEIFFLSPFMCDHYFEGFFSVYFYILNQNYFLEEQIVLINIENIERNTLTLIINGEEALPKRTK